MALKKEDIRLLKGQLKVANDRILIQKEALKSIDSYIDFEIDGRKVPQFFADYKTLLVDREKLEEEKENLKEQMRQLRLQHKKSQKEIL